MYGRPFWPIHVKTRGEILSTCPTGPTTKWWAARDLTAGAPELDVWQRLSGFLRQELVLQRRVAYGVLMASSSSNLLEGEITQMPLPPFVLYSNSIRNGFIVLAGQYRATWTPPAALAIGSAPRSAPFPYFCCMRAYGSTFLSFSWAFVCFFIS